MRVIQILLISAGITLMALQGGAQAQSARTIRIVVPYPPGGSADILARVLGQQVSQMNGVNIVVENRPGAGTVIATEYVSRARADGNTALIVGNSFVINAHMRKLAYNPLTAFTPLCKLVAFPQVIVVNAGSSYRTFGELLDAARAKPGELTMASVGPGTAQHIGFEQLKRTANLPMTYVPFPGNGPAVNSLLGDHLTAVFGNYAEVFEQLKAGKLRALATTSRTRIGVLPDLPTVAELGYRDYEVDAFLGIVVPAGVPKDAVAQLDKWLTDAMEVPAVRERLLVLGLDPVGICGADFAASLRAKYDDYAKIMRDAGIKAE